MGIQYHTRIANVTYIHVPRYQYWYGTGTGTGTVPVPSACARARVHGPTEQLLSAARALLDPTVAA